MAVPSKYIQSVVKAAKGRPKSTDWYRDKIREFGTPKSMDLIRDGKQAASPFFGRLNMFLYDPKHKKKLPYYDTFPLVLPLERYSDGLPLWTGTGIRCTSRTADFSCPYLISGNSKVPINFIPYKVSKFYK